MNNKLKYIVLAVSALSCAMANANSISRSISISAEVVSSTADFQVQPLAATGWPSQALEFKWNSVAKTFSLPADIGIKAKSANDITAMVTSPTKLINSTEAQAVIPIDVSIVLPTSGAKIKLSTTAEKIYDTQAGTAAGSWQTYQLNFAIDDTSVTDKAGALIDLKTDEPENGSYAGSVSIIFESNA